MDRVTIGEDTSTTSTATMATIVLTVASLGEVVLRPASDHGVPGLLLSHHGLTGQPSPHTVTVPAAVLSSSRLAVTEAVMRSGLVLPVSVPLLPLLPLLLVETGVLSL